MTLFASRVCCIGAAVAFGLLVFHILPELENPSVVEVATQPPVVQPFNTEVQPPVSSQPLVGPPQTVGPPVPAPVTAAQDDKVYTPNSSVIFSLGDVTITDPLLRRHIRYLSLYNIPKERRANYGQTVSFVVNSLSKRKQIYIPEFVGASDETVIRIDLTQYDIDPKAWDQLGLKGSGPRPFPEPYFHSLLENAVAVFEDRKVQKTRQVPTGRKFADGKPEMKTETFEVIEKVAVKKSENILDRAAWLNVDAITTLERELDTKFPIYRADWFINNAILPPQYYNLLGIGDTIADFEKFIFANEKVAAQARSQDKGIVLVSTVARNNRTLTRSPTLGSSYNYYWKSRDSKTSVGPRDYAKKILDEDYDATEDIATLPNGLQVYFVGDGKGKRLDFAESDIAVDNTAVDRVVRVGRSCMICHAEGIRPIGDEVRTITKFFKNRESVKLLTPDVDKWMRVRDLFGSNLEHQIHLDQQNYARAVAEATGFANPAQNAAQLSEFYDLYAEQTMSKEQVARDAGVSLVDLEKFIRGVQIDDKNRIGPNDNVILGLIKIPPRPLRRDQFEAGFQGFMLNIMSIRNHEGRIHGAPPPKVK